MADFHVIGHISNIKFTQDSIIIWVDENKNGFRRSDGSCVDPRVITWKCLFSGTESKRKYINRYFNRGMLVQIKGELLPYAVENGTSIDGYTVFVQTINIFAYPRTTVKTEQMMKKASLEHDDEEPDLDRYNSPDF